MNKAYKVLWFIIGVFCLGLAIKITLNSGFKESYSYFIISFIAFIMYIVRKKLGKADK